ncbi:uncharacterized protein LOC141909015 isoform X2 [Tubulanus polymorphus]|uniref:uncharacterized protein LOC141909015 isoform X2 n=1 Tax=Tubulanus polymorphus TaxID=672921 RepID=UPI003DA3E1F9
MNHPRRAQTAINRNSRARPLKEHEPSPFLFIGNMNADDDYDKFKRKSSVPLKNKKNSTTKFKSRSAPPSRITAPLNSESAEENPTQRFLYNNVGPSSSVTITKTPIPASPQRNVNYRVKTPFKQSIYKPKSQKPIPFPGEELRERTLIAIELAQEILKRQPTPPPKEKPRKGKLWKGRLKPMYPVNITGPSIYDCLGVQPDRRKVMRPSNTLIRRRQIMQQYPEIIEQYTLHRSETRQSLVESIHNTSRASSVNNDDIVDYDLIDDELNDNEDDELLFNEDDRNSGSAKFSGSPLSRPVSSDPRKSSAKSVRFANDPSSVVDDPIGERVMETVIHGVKVRISTTPSSRSHSALSSSRGVPKTPSPISDVDARRHRFEPIFKTEPPNRDNRFEISASTLSGGGDDEREEKLCEDDRKNVEKNGLDEAGDRNPTSTKAGTDDSNSSSSDSDLEDEERRMRRHPPTSCKYEARLTSLYDRNDDEDDGDDGDLLSRTNGSRREKSPSLNAEQTQAASDGQTHKTANADEKPDDSEVTINERATSSESSPGAGGPSGKSHEDFERALSTRRESVVSRHERDDLFDELFMEITNSTTIANKNSDLSDRKSVRQKAKRRAQSAKKHSKNERVNPQKNIRRPRSANSYISPYSQVAIKRSASTTSSSNKTGFINDSNSNRNEKSKEASASRKELSASESVEKSDEAGFSECSKYKEMNTQPSGESEIQIAEDVTSTSLENLSETISSISKSIRELYCDICGLNSKTCVCPNAHFSSAKINSEENKLLTFDELDKVLSSIQSELQLENENAKSTQQTDFTAENKPTINDLQSYVEKLESLDLCCGQISSALTDIDEFKKMCKKFAIEGHRLRPGSATSKGKLSRPSSAVNRPKPASGNDHNSIVKSNRLSASARIRPGSGKARSTRCRNDLDYLELTDYNLGVEVDNEKDDDDGETIEAVVEFKANARESENLDMTPEPRELEILATQKPMSKTKEDICTRYKPKQPVAQCFPVCFHINAKPPAGKLYYFAYGLTMNCSRMQSYLQREVSERFWAILFGFSLVFNKKGLDLEAGSFPNIEFNPYSSVEGCVYAITPKELEVLDHCMGCPKYCVRAAFPVWLQNAQVQTGGEDQLGVAQYCVPAVTYIAQDDWTDNEKSSVPTEATFEECWKSADVLSPQYKQYLLRIIG